MLLDIYPKELKTDVHTKICTLMFIEALFINTKTWNQLRCPSEGERTNKLLYIQTIQYCSSIENEHLEGIWMDPHMLLCCCVSCSVMSTLCDTMNCSPPGFSVHIIFQTRILEWIAIPFFRGSSQTRGGTLQCRQILYHLSYQGRPMHISNWKKPIWKSYILHDFNCMTFWEKKILEAVKWSIVTWGLGAGGKLTRTF